MAELIDIVIDCEHPASLARFWAAVLDGYEVAPYDQAELDRLASLGITDTEDDPTVLVVASGPGPRLFFQQVPEHKSTKNRVHLDVRADDMAAEQQRLIGLGASAAAVQPRPTFIVMHDPEGNEFCIMA